MYTLSNSTAKPDPVTRKSANYSIKLAKIVKITGTFKLLRSVSNFCWKSYRTCVVCNVTNKILKLFQTWTLYKVLICLSKKREKRILNLFPPMTRTTFHPHFSWSRIKNNAEKFRFNSAFIIFSRFLHNWWYILVVIIYFSKISTDLSTYDLRINFWRFFPKLRVCSVLF
jgi:hypothetical protein